MTSRAPRRPALHFAAAALLTAVAARCDGTPLPEPPDFTPVPGFAAPNPARIDVTAPAVGPTEVDPTRPLRVPLAGAPGAADPGAELWAIALDDPSQPVLRTQPAPDGSFSFGALEARAGERIRLVSRGARSHSPALDLLVTRPESTSDVGSVSPVPPSPLPCLTVTPGSELSVRESATLTLTSRCAGPLTVLRSELRLDDGFALSEPPSSVSPDLAATITVANDAALGPRERGDVLLVDVRDELGTLGRYAIAVFAPAL